MIKLIVSDMDGTLLNSNHQISKENLEAIRKAEEKGVHFAIATGRAYSDVKPLLDENNLKCECILSNGAEYRDKNGNILEEVAIEKDSARKIINMIKKDGLSVEIYTDDGFYTIDSEEDSLRETARRIQTFNPGTGFEDALEQAKIHPHFVNLHYIDDVEEFLKSDVKIAKFVAFYEDEETTLKVKKTLGDIEGIAISSTFTRNIEINNEQAQKGLILSRVIEKLGLKKEEVIVLGDSYNDTSLFTEFPISFAMENAVPEIKQLAKYITDTNDNAGVAKAIYKAIAGEV